MSSFMNQIEAVHGLQLSWYAAVLKPVSLL
jgi:hypothetical protein